MGNHLDPLGLDTPAKMPGALQPCSYWKYDTLHAIVECGEHFLRTLVLRECRF